jgi:hypothetical protein
MVSEDSDELVSRFSPAPVTNRPGERVWLRESVCASRVLRDRQPRGHEDSGSVASSSRPAWWPDETAREASFSVYETDHRATTLDQPFLLVFRTHHVVTADAAAGANSSVGYSGFPAYGQMRTAPLPTRGATCRLKTLHMSVPGMSP